MHVFKGISLYKTQYKWKYRYLRKPSQHLKSTLKFFYANKPIFLLWCTCYSLLLTWNANVYIYLLTNCIIIMSCYHLNLITTNINTCTTFIARLELTSNLRLNIVGTKMAKVDTNSKRWLWVINVFDFNKRANDIAFVWVRMKQF